MSIYLKLLFEFSKIGLFAIGGGYATIPFLYHLSVFYNWFSSKDLTQFLAFANIIPGPVGFNLASLVGFKVSGIIGALMAAIGIIIPSLVFVLIISKLLKEFEGNKYVKSIFYMLKPTSCAMIAGIGLKLIKDIILTNAQNISVYSIDWKALILFISLFAISLKKEHSPLFYIGVSALVGVLFHII